MTIEDVKCALSLHYQGTPFDPYGSAGTPATRGAYRPIGINRNGQLAAIQLRPYAPESCRAIQWMTYGSNAFNALAPFYANVDRTPEYLANTTGTVTTESFYWANRLIAALADAHFGACAAHIERYQEAVGARGHASVAKWDALVSEGAWATRARPSFWARQTTRSHPRCAGRPMTCWVRCSSRRAWVCATASPAVTAEQMGPCPHADCESGRRAR